jgi:hypothetical protein
MPSDIDNTPVLSLGVSVVEVETVEADPKNELPRKVPFNKVNPPEIK